MDNSKVKTEKIKSTFDILNYHLIEFTNTIHQQFV
jgi:hypothetical protein